MNIMEIINKLKYANLIGRSEEDMQSFSSSFSKFGINILLQSLSNFDEIIKLLLANNLTIIKTNGSYFLRVFSMDSSQVAEAINSFKANGEIAFLRSNIEYITEFNVIKKILINIEKCKNQNVPYKNENGYNIELLLQDTISVVENEPKEDLSNVTVNEYLKKYLQDKTLIEKLMEGRESTEDIDYDLDLELQKVENKICEEYLYPVNDRWKIVIDKKEINSFQNAKDNISLLTKLNIPVSYNDAMLIVLFYNSDVEFDVIDEIVAGPIFEGEM